MNRIGIILLVIFTAQAFGQGRDTLQLPMPVTTWDFFVYLQRCYNDSTLVDRCTGIVSQPWQQLETCTDSTYTYFSGGASLVLITNTIPRFYWTHRTPTFEGFVEYLKGKVQ